MGSLVVETPACRKTISFCATASTRNPPHRRILQAFPAEAVQIPHGCPFWVLRFMSGIGDGGDAITRPAGCGLK